jgi:sortase A
MRHGRVKQQASIGAGQRNRWLDGALRRRLLRLAETCSLLAGGGLLIASLGSLVQSEIRSARALEVVPEMRSWSDGARARYRAAAQQQPEAVLALLHAPDVDLTVPVYASYSELNLDRGAAVIDGMAYPREPGHIGIAGHRDGYFRALRDVRLGTTLTLETPDGEQRYIVDDLRVVEATEIAWLQETDSPRLTLVTCYPFHYLGDAPQRYLVRAAPLEPQTAQP